MIKVIGIALFLFSCFVFYWLGNRAFMRRNQFGLEGFETYGKALAIRAFEKIVRIAAMLGLVIGVIMFFAG
ncbi:hypothetical protein [Pseudoduganella violaceinigra]|uniref:hypothetical protein n=1 Tax=Pseudoduganella violaceinigra TaxID=246602 RepID=UPI00048371E0|nr:hypothetical protein [Pseudoduganella violaceinigra]